MYALCVFFPLIGFLLSGIIGRYFSGRFSQWITILFMAGSVIMGLILFNDIVIHGHTMDTITLFEWIPLGTSTLSWGVTFDTISTIMVCVVTIVSFLVHVYSVGYMHDDPCVPRFMSYLSFFTFTMLALVTAPNLAQLFFGWEGVGLASYLLIGFWYEKPSANDASIKAFLTNRIADAFFVLGLCGLFYWLGSLNFVDIFAKIQGLTDRPLLHICPDHSIDLINAICLCLFIGAMGKSAQFGLHVWLPDAMEGPTPVSALIHAATMVTAGVFLLIRLAPLYELAPTISFIIMIVGAFTAFFAATIGLAQNDIKRVIAYSTCSQLGYMFFACGCGGYAAGFFHLTTHAFFKSLLFLGAGSVIHAMSGEQDMRKMGGIYKHIPFTYAIMWIGSLALAGIPLFAGFYSKDAILEAAFNAGHTGVFWTGWGAAILTGIYSARLLWLTFHGKPRADDHVMAHVHESPLVMTVPLALLSIGALVSGFMLKGVFIEHSALFHTSANLFEELPSWAHKVLFAAGFLGIGSGLFVYAKQQSFVDTLAKVLKPIYMLIQNKWYIDEIYQTLIIKPLLCLSNIFWQVVDQKGIDNYGPNGAARASFTLASWIRVLHTGRIYHYALGMLLGVCLMIAFFLLQSR